ncbi:MAG TPA: YdcF family protein [Rhodopila sp.]
MEPRDTPTRPDPIVVGPDGRAMLALSTALMVLSCGTTLLLSLGYVLWIAWRTRSDPPVARRILVLGMRLDAFGKPTPDYRTRLARAATLHAQANAARIIILGGQTTAGQPSEAAAGAAFLHVHGVPATNILLEDWSRHTLENLTLYRSRFGTDGDPAVLVTSRFHLARSSLLAAGLRIRHVRCAAEQSRCPPLRHVPLMVFEALLIHWYIVGRSFARLTGNRRIAARIS